MNTNYSWYSQLVKPSWAPPSWLFGSVWTFLYAIIFVSFGTVFYKVIKKEIPIIVALPFVLNLLFNFLFTYLQFGLKNNYLAFLDVILVLGTLIWAMLLVWPNLRWIALVNIPNLLWVSFATILQATVTYLNR